MDDKNYTVVFGGMRRGCLGREDAIELARRLNDDARIGRSPFVARVFYRDGSEVSLPESQTAH